MEFITRSRVLIIVGILFLAVIAYVVLQGSGLGSQNMDDTTGGELKPSVMLHVGETTEVEGMRLTLNAVLKDTRCALGSPCDRSEILEVSVTAEEGQSVDTFTLSMNGAARAFGARSISVVMAEPYPEPDVFINPDAYVVGFWIE